MCEGLALWYSKESRDPDTQVRLCKHLPSGVVGTYIGKSYRSKMGLPIISLVMQQEGFENIGDGITQKPQEGEMENLRLPTQGYGTGSKGEGCFC